mgnify:CR=1 FL=1
MESAHLSILESHHVLLYLKGEKYKNAQDVDHLALARNIAKPEMMN